MDGDAGGDEGALALLPGGVRADVDVVGGRAAQGIPHPATDEPRLVARGLESVEHGEAVGGRKGGVYSLRDAHGALLRLGGLVRTVYDASRPCRGNTENAWYQARPP